MTDGGRIEVNSEKQTNRRTKEVEKEKRKARGYRKSGR